MVRTALARITLDLPQRFQGKLYAPLAPLKFGSVGKRRQTSPHSGATEFRPHSPCSADHPSCERQAAIWRMPAPTMGLGSVSREVSGGSWCSLQRLGQDQRDRIRTVDTRNNGVQSRRRALRSITQTTTEDAPAPMVDLHCTCDQLALDFPFVVALAYVLSKARAVMCDGAVHNTQWHILLYVRKHVARVGFRTNLECDETQEISASGLTFPLQYVYNDV